MAAVHFVSVAADNGYLFAVDNQGRLWGRVPGGQKEDWALVDMPEEPAQ